MAGSHLAEYILKAQPQCQVFGVKRWRSPLENVSHIQNQVSLIDCDLTGSSAVLDLIKAVKPDLVFHLAAQSFVPDSWKNPEVTIGSNIFMQLNLFEAIRRAGINPVIQVALTSEEYGRVHEHELPISEKNPLRPLSPYAVSKVAQDMLAYQYFESYGFKVIRTRTFNHEGPRRGEVFVTSNFAKQIAEIERGMKPPVLHVGNLTAKRDWMDVRDVVRAYWLSMEKCKPGEDYVIASGVTRTVQEMLNYLLSLTKVSIEIVADESRMRPSDVQVLQGDPTKFKAATGWTQEYTFEQTMRDLLEWWRDQLKIRELKSVQAAAKKA